MAQHLYEAILLHTFDLWGPGKLIALDLSWSQERLSFQHLVNLKFPGEEAGEGTLTSLSV